MTPRRQEDVIKEAREWLDVAREEMKTLKGRVGGLSEESRMRAAKEAGGKEVELAMVLREWRENIEAWQASIARTQNRIVEVNDGLVRDLQAMQQDYIQLR